MRSRTQPDRYKKGYDFSENGGRPAGRPYFRLKTQEWGRKSGMSKKIKIQQMLQSYIWSNSIGVTVTLTISSGVQLCQAARKVSKSILRFSRFLSPLRPDLGPGPSPWILSPRFKIKGPQKKNSEKS